jgi:hypothetical protein
VLLGANEEHASGVKMRAVSWAPSGVGPLSWGIEKGKGHKKKSWGGQKVIKTTPKKRYGHCLLCWPAGAKKKNVGVKQEKNSQVIWANA